MKRHLLYIVVLLIIFASCRKHYDAPIPGTGWNLFDSAAAKPLSSITRNKIEGVYGLTEASSYFGSTAAAKWSYEANGADTTYYLSFFCEKDVSYIILEGKKLDSTILLNGYWRKMASTETGKAQLMITKLNGAGNLLNISNMNTPDSLIITGTISNGDNVPDILVRLKYQRPLFNAKPLERVVHRGGGQTADLLPASENSAEIIRMASRFGATGIEVDVRMTKDGVPILYHDASLSERLIQKNGMIGPVENYTYDQLYNLVKLIRGGEHIPTLRDALSTMVYNTPLRYVWMDIKFNGSLQLIHDLQTEYTQRAASIGRTVEITIGIPDQNVLNQFIALPDYQNIPAVSELASPYVEQANARIWGPRWTLGLQNDEVQQIHSEGRRAFVWTLDAPQNIYTYLTEGHFDGILTNYPSALAYYYYVQQ